MMFSKDNEKLESFIGANSDFQGDVHMKGTLRIDGRVDGQVNADCVILSDSAVIKGNVTAKKIVVGGRIEGNLNVKELVEIKSKGKVLGDIFTHKLAVMEGGEFNGQIEMNKEAGTASALESKNTNEVDRHWGESAAKESLNA